MKKENIRRYAFIKMFPVVMIMVMMFSLNVQAAKLSKTSITFEKGQTYTLKMKGTKKKVTWKTKNKKIAGLSNKKKSSVRIKAVKVGKTTITAKVGKKTYKCKVTVVEKKKTSSTKNTTESTSTTEEKTTDDSSGTTEKTKSTYKVWIITKWGKRVYSPVYVNYRFKTVCSCGYETEDQDEWYKHEKNHLSKVIDYSYSEVAIWDSVYTVETRYPVEGYWIEVEVGTYPDGLEWRNPVTGDYRLMKDVTTGEEFRQTEGFYCIDKSGN